MYEYPGASIDEIIEATEVDPKLILRFLKEERIEMTHADGLLICEKCGAPITSGTICSACKNKLSRALQSVLARPEANKDQKSKAQGASASKDKLHVNVHDR